MPDRPEHRASAGSEGVPPTSVRLLPTLLATFMTSMLIDVATDWPWWVRWILALGVGLAVGVVAVAVWARRRRG
ncbi:hypothetical protein NJC10_01665 [Micrococcus sp. M4NT]|uniref:hypothetical protein n=1 Tax=Micrococcus sp. M4NT TaxID=2957501 RepID=UPI0029AC20B3|nr:hypothetical protein [Micrococcus sp. M4NT]MDX2340386.1 hypothetical protein [Micrococcus sp. M4NT]